MSGIQNLLEVPVNHHGRVQPWHDGEERTNSLPESVELYKTIAESAYDWIYLRAPDGQLLYVSPSSERITGYRPREFMENPSLLSAIVHGEDAAFFRSHLEKAGVKEDTQPFDFRIVTKEGSVRWVSHACSAVFDRDGRLVGRRATNRDVSRRKALEEEVRSLAGFPSENPSPVLRASGEGAILYANAAGDALMRMWGCALGDLTPLFVRDIITGSFRQKVQGNVDVECDGRIYAFAVIPPPDTDYVNMYGTDVTERRKAEDSLRAARDVLDREVRARTAELRKTNRLLRMISACNQALVGIDDEKELVLAVCQLILDEGGFRMAWVGYAEQDDARQVRPVGSAGFEDGYLQNAAITWADTERGRGPTGTAIRERRTCIGRDFLTEPDLAPWRDEALRRGFRSSIALPLMSEGRAFGALTIYSDQPSAFDQEQQTLLAEMAGDLAFGILSVRARAQRDLAMRTLEKKTAQLRFLAAELVQAEERERRRIGSVLHDQLQQLLAGARFGLESLRTAGAAGRLSETVDKIDAMVKESLDVSRSLTTELSPSIQLGSDVESLLRWLAVWARERFGLKVSIETAEGALVESEEIRMTLFRTVRELLFNVVKHAGVKEARISFALDEDGQLRLVVRDEGRGFDPEAIRARGGTSGGFGLFTMQERLEALGGCMNIESRAGKGSCFTIWVPMHQVQHRGREQETLNPPQAGSETPRNSRSFLRQKEDPCSPCR